MVIKGRLGGIESRNGVRRVVGSWLLCLELLGLLQRQVLVTLLLCRNLGVLLFSQEWVSGEIEALVQDLLIHRQQVRLRDGLGRQGRQLVSARAQGGRRQGHLVDGRREVRVSRAGERGQSRRLEGSRGIILLGAGNERRLALGLIGSLQRRRLQDSGSRGRRSRGFYWIMGSVGSSRGEGTLRGGALRRGCLLVLEVRHARRVVGLSGREADAAWRFMLLAGWMKKDGKERDSYR